MKDIHIAFSSCTRESTSPGGPPILVGWVEDDEDVYLLPDASHQVVLRMAQEQNETFPWSLKTLSKRLRDRGVLKSVDEGRDRIPVRKLFGEERCYVLHFAAETVAPFEFEPDLAIPTAD